MAVSSSAQPAASLPKEGAPRQVSATTTALSSRVSAPPSAQKPDASAPRHAALRRLPATAVALSCTFADYLGLAIVQPTLPFYLADLGEADVALWTGIILTSQFAGIVLSNPVWGAVADRAGPRRALQLAMALDAVLLAASAAASSPLALVVMRFFVGCASPLVPAIATLFASLPPERTARGMGHFALSVQGGFVLGSAVAGPTFDAGGWVATCLLAGALAALAAALLLLAQPDAARGTRSHGARPEGVRDALRSAYFTVHAATSVLTGYAMNLSFAVMAVALRAEFAWGVLAVSRAFLVVIAVMALCFLLVVPFAARRLGTERLIGTGLVLLVPASALLLSPLRERDGLWLTGLVAFHITASATVHVPNQVRAPQYTRNSGACAPFPPDR